MADMWILDKGDQPLAILSTDAEGVVIFIPPHSERN